MTVNILIWILLMGKALFVLFFLSGVNKLPNDMFGKVVLRTLLWVYIGATVALSLKQGEPLVLLVYSMATFSVLAYAIIFHLVVIFPDNGIQVPKNKVVTWAARIFGIKPKQPSNG